MVIMKVQHEPRRIGTQSNALDWRNILLGGIMLAVVSAFGSTLPTRLAQAQPVANGQAPKPNIVVMLMDNLGYGELGVEACGHRWATLKVGTPSSFRLSQSTMLARVRGHRKSEHLT